MKYKTLNYTDLNISNICLGTANFGDKLSKEESFEILDYFVRQGGNFIDTANVYCRWIPGLGNCGEKIIGEWLKARGAYNNVVVATKGAHPSVEDKNGRSRVTEADIRMDLEDSMRTLGLDWIDFYWLHRDDPSKPIEEIMDILLKLKAAGKIRYFGLSNYSTLRLEQAKTYLERCGMNGPYAVSNQWSLAAVNPGKNINQDPTLVQVSSEECAWYRRSGVPAIPFSSTAFGFFEKLKRAGVVVHDGKLVSKGTWEIIPAPIRDVYWNEKNLKIYEKLMNIQKETGYSLQGLSVAYFVNLPFQVIPIGSVRSTEQLEGFLEASEIEISLDEF